MPDIVYIGGLSIIISIILLLPNIINYIRFGSFDERKDDWRYNIFYYCLWVSNLYGCYSNYYAQKKQMIVVVFGSSEGDRTLDFSYWDQRFTIKLHCIIIFIGF